MRSQILIKQLPLMCNKQIRMKNLPILFFHSELLDWVSSVWCGVSNLACFLLSSFHLFWAFFFCISCPCSPPWALFFLNSSSTLPLQSRAVVSYSFFFFIKCNLFCSLFFFFSFFFCILSCFFFLLVILYFFYYKIFLFELFYSFYFVHSNVFFFHSFLRYLKKKFHSLICSIVLLFYLLHSYFVFFKYFNFFII